jgi:hypothetical protein
MQVVNGALMAAALARGLKREHDLLQARPVHVLALADTGAANRPITEDCRREPRGQRIDEYIK